MFSTPLLAGEKKDIVNTEAVAEGFKTFVAAVILLPSAK